ncbi:MAG TPA: NAD-dependent epimerase/dehydratase family protein [Acidimicrobiales bacterium]|nr:NAD-dependent epimerase/dehydratase family protein [Acidimicrobiales bacterium]
MNVLMLGGTMFLGRHLVEVALDAGHNVTLFNRGQTNADLYPEVRRLRGDRSSGDYGSLAGERFDAVVDTCGYFPRAVEQAIDALDGRIGHYTFVSSVSAYRDYSQAGVTEDSPVGQLDDPEVEEVTGESYGPLKALCEEAAANRMGGRALVVRPGLIVGPHDPSDRFTYWVRRVGQGGEVLVPESPDSPTQLIDARDLASFTLQLLEQGTSGVYNTVGPNEPATLGDLLDSIRRVSESDATFTYASVDFLAEHGVQGWVQLPMWVPSAGEIRGINQISPAKAIAAGLTSRPIDEITRDTFDWDRTREQTWPMKAGLTPEREAELLGAWHARA